MRGKMCQLILASKFIIKVLEEKDKTKITLPRNF